jgi:hypothetical protein
MVVYAADHPQRREYWVGSTTAATLAANALAPGLLDRYLARTGFDSQQTDQPHDPNAPTNLFEPADGDRGHDFGTGGMFGGRAIHSDPQLWASRHHGVLALAGAALLSGLLAWRRR